MTLAELEKNLDVKFPKKFHEIYKTGAMEWLEVEGEKYNENIEHYLNDPKTFFVLSGEIFPICFNSIPEYIEKLNETIEFHENLMNVKLDKKLRFIPFALNGEFDYYCFMYEKGSDEPKIVKIDYNTRYIPDIIGKDFDEFLYIMMLSCAADCAFDDDFFELEREHWKNHFNYLLPEYRKKITEKITESTSEELFKFYLLMNFEEIEIFS
ncbi:MAG: SMI1/KNR4 family protein [Ruminococcus sp.]|nr:SMI1/KNR4 family protein [Ruminococcus sp.]